MPYDTALTDRITDIFTARRVPFETKAMMGGLCFMVRGKMCVGVTKDRLMVRLDPALETQALTQPGCKPMELTPSLPPLGRASPNAAHCLSRTLRRARLTGRPMKGYVFVHPEGCESESQLRHWLALALDFNPRAKASKKRRGG